MRVKQSDGWKPSRELWRKLLRLTTCACNATSFNSWTLFNISCLVEQSSTQPPLRALCLSRTQGPLIKELDIVTTHSAYSTSLSLRWTVSLLLSRWSLALCDICCATVERDEVEKKPLVHVLFLCGWQPCMLAAMLTLRSCGFTNSPNIATQLDSSRSSALPASHSLFILIVHGLHNAMNKEAESMRKVKLWWKKCVNCSCQWELPVAIATFMADRGQDFYIKVTAWNVVKAF